MVGCECNKLYSIGRTSIRKEQRFTNFYQNIVKIRYTMVRAVQNVH